MSVRINKYISGTGFCSRRDADELIKAGRVTINGVVPSLTSSVERDDVVQIDGQTLQTRTAKPGKRKHVYIALNKPVGITCTTDTAVKGNIADFVDHQERIFPIGRLDKDSEGLILLTSNGDIVNELLRAENRKEKEYLVGVNRAVTPQFLRGMAKGVRIRREVTLPCKTRKIAPYGFSIILTQGLNRQIRLMAAAFDYKVTQLRRVRIINVTLGGLRIGQWRNLTDAELRGLLPERTEW